jgi:hypothetical protein
MKKWLVTASIIVVAGSALCLPVKAEPNGESVVGTIPDTKLGELEGSRLLDHALADLYLRGVEKLSIAYAFDGVGARDFLDVVTDDPRPLALQGPIGDAPLVAQDETVSSTYWQSGR